MARLIRRFRRDDEARVTDMCVAAFEPVHAGFADALGPELFALHYAGWREQYAATIAGIDPEDASLHVFVIEEDGLVVGFAFSSVDAERRTAEFGLNAVDPAFQGKGVGRELYAFVLADMKALGAESVEVGTGNDAAHAPARAAYARAGFDRAIESIYYFRKL